MKKFNKDKYLKKLRFKKYKRYLYIGIPCLLVLLIGIYFAYSKFSVSKEEEVVRTTVGDFISGDAVIGAYIDGEYSKTIPGKNDGYVVEKIVCDNDASASWNNDSWGIVLTNLTKRTKCNVYFKTKIKLNENTKVELVQDTFVYDGKPHVPVLKKVTTEDGLDVPISDFEDTTCSIIQVGSTRCDWFTKESSNFYGSISATVTIKYNQPLIPDITN